MMPFPPTLVPTFPMLLVVSSLSKVMVDVFWETLPSLHNVICLSSDTQLQSKAEKHTIVVISVSSDKLIIDSLLCKLKLIFASD